MSLIAVTIKLVSVPLRALKSVKVITKQSFISRITILIISWNYHNQMLKVTFYRHIRMLAIDKSLALGRILNLLAVIKILRMMKRLSMLGLILLDVMIKSRRRKSYSRCSSSSSMMRDLFHSSNIINSIIHFNSPKLLIIHSHSIVIRNKSLGILSILT